MKTILIILVLFFVACSSAPNKKTAESKNTLDYGECSIGGNSVNWAANYCMWLGNSDNYFDKHIQKCIKDNNSHLTDAVECEKREYYKMKFCGHYISLGRIKGAKKNCIEDKDNDLLWWKKVI